MVSSPYQVISFFLLLQLHSAYFRLLLSDLVLEDTDVLMMNKGPDILIPRLHLKMLAPEDLYKIKKYKLFLHTISTFQTATYILQDLLEIQKCTIKIF